jgi:hypothetical protein
MKYYLAEITSPSGKNWFHLIKADSKSHAITLAHDYFGFGYIIEVQDTINED